jgi:hypothetical protein
VLDTSTSRAPYIYKEKVVLSHGGRNPLQSTPKYNFVQSWPIQTGLAGLQNQLSLFLWETQLSLFWNPVKPVFLYQYLLTPKFGLGHEDLEFRSLLKKASIFSKIG